MRDYLKLAFAILIFLMILGCTNKSDCGNGIIEDGETLQTCCEDTGCLGDQICQEHKCLEPVCNECEYLKDHECVEYDCCQDEDCTDQQICSNNECQDIECGECQYLENHSCHRHECCSKDDCKSDELCANKKCIKVRCHKCEYVDMHKCIPAMCCSDSDCDDSNINTQDKCVDPGTKLAECHNALGECEDGTNFGECNDKGQLCAPPGSLGFWPGCESDERECFQKDKSVAIVEFVAPNVEDWPEWQGHKFIDLLNNEEPYQYFEEPSPARNIYSINYIPVFFNQESNKYGENVDLAIDIIGPYYLTEFPPLGPNKRNQQVYLDRDYLEEYVENKGINLDSYDNWIALYIFNYYKLDDEEGTTLHSNANVIHFQIDNHFYPTSQMISTIAHELAHLFCAKDKYIRFTCEHPDGVPNPHNYPQEKACLMCNKIVQEEEGSSWTINDISDIVICEKTAEEFGWTE